MTPKEKALELDKKFSEATRGYLSGHKAALLAVDEIINSIMFPLQFDNRLIHQEVQNQLKYWKEVKAELKNL